MSLRSRLVLLLAIVVALLAGGQYLLIRALGAELEAELGTAAASVGRSVLALTAAGPLPSDPGAGGLCAWALPPATGQEPEGRDEPRLRVRIVERRGEPSGSGEAAPGLESPGQGILPAPIPFPGLELERAERVLVLRRGDAVERLELPSRGLEEAVQRYSRRLLLGSLLLLGAGLLMTTLVAHRVTAPLADLSRAAERLGAGELGAQAPGEGPGEVGRAIVAFNRMSERLQELDARERHLRSQEHLGELGEIGRGLAHSLRNPLNALGLTVEELAQRASDGAPLAAEARRQISRIDRSLRAFLALGAAEAGASAVAPVDLAAVARDVALEASQSQSAPDGGGPSAGRVGVEVDGPPSPALLPGVEAEVRAMLHALVINAVEASPAGGQVVVKVASRRAGLEVTVDDQGPGLPSAVRERLFAPHLTTKPNGAGVGLYLAHRLATTRYDGTLELEDRPEGGTRALLRLAPRRGASDG